MAVPNREGLADRFGLHERQRDRSDKVVDVDRDHQAPSVLDEHELPAPHPLERADGPRDRAGPVHVARPDHSNRLARTRTGANQRVRCPFGVDVGDPARSRRGLLVQVSGMLVTPDRDRADVDEAFDALFAGGVEHVPRPVHVDSDELLHRPPVAHPSGGVDHELCAAD